mgnify:CR=1 FL=1
MAKNNVKIIKTSWPNKIFNLSIKLFKYPKLDKLIIKKGKLDKLHIFISPNINFTALSKDIKFFQTIHDLSYKIYPEFYSIRRRMWHKLINPKKLCQQAEVIICPSQSTKNDIAKHYKIDKDKIKIIYPGLSMANKDSRVSKEKYEQVRKKYNLPNNYILFLGTIEPRKNLLGLIESYEQFINEQGGDKYLVIAGVSGWKNSKIYKRVKKSRYNKYIKFIGYVDREDKQTLYSMALIFIYPSFYEGFGIPVLEALNTKTPTITSNRSSLPEIYGKSSYLINPNKTTEIKRAINKLLNSDRERKILIQAGEEVVKKFNWKDSAKKLNNILSV